VKVVRVLVEMEPQAGVTVCVDAVFTDAADISQRRPQFTQSDGGRSDNGCSGL